MPVYDGYLITGSFRLLACLGKEAWGKTRQNERLTGFNWFGSIQSWGAGHEWISAAVFICLCLGLCLDFKIYSRICGTPNTDMWETNRHAAFQHTLPVVLRRVLAANSRIVFTMCKHYDSSCYEYRYAPVAYQCVYPSCQLLQEAEAFTLKTKVAWSILVYKSKQHCSIAKTAK